MMLSYQEFAQIDIRTGTIVKAEPFPRVKKPAYKVWVDFGAELGILQTSAQITIRYALKTLIGRQVLGCINLGEKNIAGFISQFLLLGFADENGAICLATVDPRVPNGQKMH
ncbi:MULTISPECIES: tRNA-binding protein [Legionella]|uniref:tRNA-binding protein n=1 Tax=Legionella septentrionalis TaxID=2498109 RepID=A0A3S0VM30_9GAMM|nr:MULTISPECIES: tRNA-binding protein [Legionella]MCP0914646.1 tRNA-binding protein [Legionella sp. 27cVA30]RUQ81012.1 tRNA-binding protein [Legionella septentrionalis]RUQ99352.1 tRNA-binding protein [Legionella septentrionalis]RUR08759.1 tRNA-binding protein [Legionella septentrionalis]RUR13323.1 tRNA-binding protein [Legionella septentrionalis]